MTIDKNISPYYDDFTSDAGFHQILFKPGYAVQARELTQAQSIIRDQIAKFGNHIFKHGSIVIPGNSIADLAIQYVKVNVDASPVSLFNKQRVVGAVSGVVAIVKEVLPATATESAVLYVSYVSGSIDTGNVIFQDGEEIRLFNSPSTKLTTLESNSTGAGAIAHVNAGVYYINGSFVQVDPQSIVISKFDDKPSCHVLLKITEEIISSESDNTLLDPAQGSYNYSAPGADRSKISLTLATLPLGSPLTADYVEIMRFNDGLLEEHSRNAKYSELEKSLARRTFDESGNYVVNGILPTVREHLKSNSNNGVYSGGDSSKIVVDVTPGKAYINGFEIEKYSNTKIVIDKARTSSHIKSTDIAVRPEFGQYITVSSIVGGFSTINQDIVDIYNDNDFSNALATKIGTARVIGVDYLVGDISTDIIYKLWISEVSIIAGYGIESAGGIRYGSNHHAIVLTQYTAPVLTGGFVVGEIVLHSSNRTGTVKYWDASSSTLYVFKHNHERETPRVGDQIVGSTSAASSIINTKILIQSIGQSGLVFRLSKPSVYSLRDATTTAYDLAYTIQKELVIVTNSSGDGSISVSFGETINPVEVGTFVAIGPAGPVALSKFSIDVAGNTLTLLKGPISSVVTVYASVAKDNVAPKTKTLSTNTQVVTSPTNNITLENTDIISINSIIDTVGDITANYSLFNGQGEYAYKLGSITLKNGRALPVGKVTINYSYYGHSIAGDFFCVDSYPLGILDNITSYTSESTGQVYDLPACLDFRSSVGSDNTFTGINSRKSNFIISGTVFKSKLQFFVTRIDLVTIDASGKIDVISGIPSELPKVPPTPLGAFAINAIFIPPYTKTAALVAVRRLDVERFTMNDIKKIVDRVDRVENFATITASEISVTGQNIVDAATGLNKFKTGYLVENFSSPLTIARTTSGDYAAIFVGSTLQAKMENLKCNLELLPSSSGVINKNGTLMLPYTEVVFASQTLSSRVTNLNPFLMIRWNGVLGIVPASDDWVDTRELPTIFENKSEEVVVNVYASSPCPPAPSYSSATLPATSYGGWYGQVLGRGGETGGVDYWTSNIQSGATVAQQVQQFLTSAQVNFNSASNSGHSESTFNPISVSSLANNNVLTSTTTYAYQGDSIIATTSGTNLDGTTFTKSSPY